MRESSQKQPGTGFLGWLGRTRHGPEGYLYALHRVSGLVLLLFLIAHVFVTASRLLGPDAWTLVMGMTASPLVQFLEYLVFVAFAFHAFNGLRLILVEVGIAVGRGERLVYPYHGSVRKQRPLLLVAMVLAGLLMVAGGIDLLSLSH